MNPRYFLYIFYFLAIAELLAVHFGWQIRMFTKPMIMISLITYYLVATRRLDLTNGLFLMALVAALAGDILLMKDNLFIAGLGAFLVMQLLYIVCFKRDKCFAGQREYLYGSILILLMAAVMSQLWQGLGEMRVPVLVYSTAILSMSWVSFTRDFRLPGYWWVFAGTLLFIISDSCIAVERFTSISVGSITVMATYIAAQYLIVRGYAMRMGQDT